MKYPKEYLDEIKLRLKVSQVVSKTVQLKNEERSSLVFRRLKMKKAHLLQSMMKKNFITALVVVSTEIFLIF